LTRIFTACLEVGELGASRQSAQPDVRAPSGARSAHDESFTTRDGEVSMPFPKKFKQLLEPDPVSLPRPDYAWLCYAVCACDAGACGWTGWVTDGVFRRREAHFPTSTGDEALTRPEPDSCPVCGRRLFRTDVAVRMEPSADQVRPLKLTRDDDADNREYE